MENKDTDLKNSLTTLEENLLRTKSLLLGAKADFDRHAESHRLLAEHLRNFHLETDPVKKRIALNKAKDFVSKLNEWENL